MNILKIFEKLSEQVTIGDLIIFGAGSLLLGCWLLRTSLGRRALERSDVRRNNMPLYIPVVIFIVWNLLFAAGLEAGKEMWPEAEKWQKALYLNLSLGGSSLIFIVIILALVKRHFVQGWRGFGLNPKTIVKDFAIGFLNLFSTYPLIMGAVVVVILGGKLWYGEDFEFKQHEQLKTMVLNPQLSLRIVIVITTVIIAPVFEEMLFRGLFQTTLRSVLHRPWAAIFITSVIFAMIHGAELIEQWPAIAVLGVCLGYAYERSGSLFRSICIHAMFNGASVVGVLSQ